MKVNPMDVNCSEKRRQSVKTFQDFNKRQECREIAIQEDSNKMIFFNFYNLIRICPIRDFVDAYNYRDQNYQNFISIQFCCFFHYYWGFIYFLSIKFCCIDTFCPHAAQVLMSYILFAVIRHLKNRVEFISCILNRGNTMNFQEHFIRSEQLHSLYMDHEDKITLTSVSGVDCI